MNLDEEIRIAKEVRKNAYVPHSKYWVGAALKGKSGKIYSGCNVQNDGLMSICGERTAFIKAISEGEKEFEHIVVCGGADINILEDCLPCGYCRQFMNEFVDASF
ncbi:MAG: cytidine deaminase [Oscillospiraceae bacterium]|nr:cytidine deaminase [Oscillospiraceae bacterium]